MSRIQQVFGKALFGAALALSVALPLGAAAQGMPTDVIYNFTGGADGATPGAGLIRDTAGNLYGTAGEGGSSNCKHGCGVVFKLSPLGAATTLYTFTGRDGRTPVGKLIADAAGNLYGTTYFGGRGNLGIVFKLTLGGVETVLYSFAGGSDGANPYAGLTMDTAGNFYGTTSFGGPSNAGVVFKLAPDGTETVLHAFTGGADGSDPLGDLILDKRGALYGATFSDHGGPGMIFKIAAGGKFSVLYTFTGFADGHLPHGGLIMDRQGALYGTTFSGDSSPCDTCGVVFKLAPDGTETVLHSFTGSDGAGSRASLIMDRQGNLFGTTEGGGSFSQGTVFQLSPDGTETVLHSFASKQDSPPDGAAPFASLILYMNKLYGTTLTGGNCSTRKFGCGTVFGVKRAK